MLAAAAEVSPGIEQPSKKKVPCVARLALGGPATTLLGWKPAIVLLQRLVETKKGIKVQVA